MIRSPHSDIEIEKMVTIIHYISIHIIICIVAIHIHLSRAACDPRKERMLNLGMIIRNMLP